MFQFPALASNQVGWHSFRMPGCPIRKSSDQWSFAPTRSLSQLITSFIASMSQGIRHAPLSTFFRHNRAFYRQWAQCSRRKWPVGHSYFQLYCFDYQVLRLVFYFTVSLVSICQRSLGNFELWDLNFELFNLWSFLFLKDHSREWRITDSNRWPPACKAGALASWANPPGF